MVRRFVPPLCRVSLAKKAEIDIQVMVGTKKVPTTTSCLFPDRIGCDATLAGARNPAAEILIGYANPLTGEIELATTNADCVD